MTRVAAFLLALFLVIAPSARASEPAFSVTFDGAVSLERCSIAGTERIRIASPDGAATDELSLLVFAERFRAEPAELDDLARHHLIASGRYEPGGVDLASITVDGRPATARMESGPGRAVTAKISLGRTLALGESAEVVIELALRLPNLRDVFGCDGRLLVAAEGWLLEPLAPGGGIAPHDLRVALELPPASDALLGSQRVRGPDRIELDGRDRDLGPLIVSAIPFVSSRSRIGDQRVTLYGLPRGDWVQRSGVFPSADEALAESLPAVLAGRRSRGDLTLVRLPLSWLPSFSSPGVVLVSDRLFEVFVELRPLHARELAYAIYLGDEIAAAREREAPRDVGWVAEGLAWRRAQELYASELRRGREVHEWIDLLDVFAIVDRFETAPRIPLVRPLFPTLASDDALRLRMSTALEDRPPGRMLFWKLESRLRPERFSLLLGERDRDGGALRGALSASDADFVDAWLAPLPDVNYRLLDVERDADRVRFRIEREGAVASDETIEVDVGGRRAFADLQDGRASIDVAGTEDDVVALDPQRRILQARLDDDRDPPELQVLLDSADVEVSSTEFGFSTLFVGRRRYDYRKDLAAAAFVSDRGYGLHSGFQLHGGRPIDRNLFRDNLFLYYAVEELDRSFGEDRDGAPRAGGRLAGFGLRFNHFDAFWFENPSRSHHVRVFADGYDRSLGSRYGFVQTGASLAVTRPLRADTIVALQLSAGFTLRTGDRPIPPQGLFSLGGFQSIRGIGANEDLDRHIAVARVEIRRLLPLRLDLDLDDVLIARRLQLKAFVDAGRVARHADRVFDVPEFAVAAGVGVNLFYDFLGFFPTSFYVDLATRVDRRDSVQVLFGGRQPF